MHRSYIQSTWVGWRRETDIWNIILGLKEHIFSGTNCDGYTNHLGILVKCRLDSVGLGGTRDTAFWTSSQVMPPSAGHTWNQVSRWPSVPMCPPALHVRFLWTRPILTTLGICSLSPHFMNETDHWGPVSPAGKLLLAQTQVVWLREWRVTLFPTCHSVGICQFIFCL